MKRFIALILTLLSTTALSVAVCGENSASGPGMKFEKVNHDFGTLPHRGEKVAVEFTFVNDGNAPLVVTRTTTSCRCITIAAPKRPIRPGASGSIVVTYDPKDKGVFNKGISVEANIPGGSVTLFVRGEVE